MIELDEDEDREEEGDGSILSGELRLLRVIEVDNEVVIEEVKEGREGRRPEVGDTQNGVDDDDDDDS